jgi:hypothetical protein
LISSNMAILSLREAGYTHYEEHTGGGAVLAIPHSGNLSNGLMFATERLNGKLIDKAYAELACAGSRCMRLRKSRETEKHIPNFR